MTESERYEAACNIVSYFVTSEEWDNGDYINHYSSESDKSFSESIEQALEDYCDELYVDDEMIFDSPGTALGVITIAFTVGKRLQAYTFQWREN